MKNKTRINYVIIALFTACVVFVLPASMLAQEGRFANVYNKAQVKGYIDKLETSSDRFRTDFQRRMNESNLNGTSTEDRYNGYVKDFENALDRLQSRFKSSSTWWESRNEVQEMISRAQPVNTMMNEVSFARYLETQWRAIRNDINKVADTYDLPGLNGGGWNGGPWNGGGNGGGGNASAPPSWAIGTWYWTNGPDRQMTINSNGSITLLNGGRTSYGSYVKGVILLDGNRSKLTRNGNNIRTDNQTTGEISDYAKNAWGGGGGGGGWNGGGNIGAPPSWAVGTWYWTNGAGRQMTIESNGRITLLNGGQTSYGSYNKGVIYLDGNLSNLTRNGNNIRTYNQTSGETSDYSKGQWNGGGGGGGNASTPPNWARGTFVWTNGPDRSLRIDSNGKVTLYGGGQTSYGTYSDMKIYLNGDVSTVTQINGGIRTYNQTNGEVSDYRKQ